MDKNEVMKMLKNVEGFRFSESFLVLDGESFCVNISYQKIKAIEFFASVIYIHTRDSIVSYYPNTRHLFITYLSGR